MPWSFFMPDRTARKSPGAFVPSKASGTLK